MKRRAFLQAAGVAAGAAAASALLPRRSAGATAGSGAKVLIVGGGFAGSSCALRLRHLNPRLKLTLVDPDQVYTCCPMSNGVLAGQRNIESLQVSRRGLTRRGVRYVNDRVTHIDARGRRARLGGGAELAYDRLVLAGGIRFLWNRPEGYTEAAAIRMPHAWQAGAQTELLAAQLRSIADGGVVGISVPPGPMRCPPGPFERASLIAEFLHVSKPRCKILIFDANNRFPRQAEFSDAWRALYPGMIEWISGIDGGAIDRVDPVRMLMAANAREHRVEVANIIPPQAPTLLAVESGLASDHGWCPVHPLTFESTLVPNAYVIGDSCIAEPMPKSASAACSQAIQCAMSITASLAGRELMTSALDSVCYSALTAGTALSIHGRFRATASGIEQMPDARQTSLSSTEESLQAAEWYRRTVRESFG